MKSEILNECPIPRRILNNSNDKHYIMRDPKSIILNFENGTDYVISDILDMFECNDIQTINFTLPLYFSQLFEIIKNGILIDSIKTSRYMRNRLENTDHYLVNTYEDEMKYYFSEVETIREEGRHLYRFTINAIKDQVKTKFINTKTDVIHNIVEIKDSISILPDYSNNSGLVSSIDKLRDVIDKNNKE